MNKTWHAYIGLALLVILAIYIAVALKGEPMEKLQLTAGYAAMVLVFGYGAVVLTALANGAIDLKNLIEEMNGGASMSRFQLLIFTFIIGFSFLFVTLKTGRLPAIPAEVLTLLGISASTFAVSKAIQAGLSDSGQEQADKDKPGKGGNGDGNK
jgi:membrane protease YdiL (CAAX protease family)